MQRDLVAIGGSAGSIEAVRVLLAGLPKDFAAAVLVVIHFPPSATSVLPQILARTSMLPVAHAVQGEAILPARVYIAPPDQHLLVHGDRILLTRGPRENSSRPAIDPLFRSVARWRGPRAIAVVLSGTLDDGAIGVLEVHRLGGLVFVQSPSDALFADMPMNAMHHLVPDIVAPAADLAGCLVRHIADDVGDGPFTIVPTDLGDPEAEMERDPVIADEVKDLTRGPPSGFTCPDCQGALWELHEGELFRYRCRVGHAHSPESLVAAQLDSVEEAMWAAYRTLEESAAVSRKLGAFAESRGFIASAEVHRGREKDAQDRARQILRALQEPR